MFYKARYSLDKVLQHAVILYKIIHSCPQFPDVDSQDLDGVRLAEKFNLDNQGNTLETIAIVISAVCSQF